MVSIKVENVDYSYRTKYQTVHALEQVSCKFETSHMYAIVGESGSGKTTCLFWLVWM